MSINIGKMKIGEDNPAFIIAELSANHNKDINIALETIKKAKECGADAIKIQTYTPDTMTINSNEPDFIISKDTIWEGKSLYQLYQEAYTPWEWFPKLLELANELDITLFSSVFDKTSVDYLETFNIPAYKIASFEITDLPLIEYVANKGKPVIISTGIASLEEIEEAVNICRNYENNQVALLKCTSSYPAPLNKINLSTIPDMQERFNFVVGLSDHTLGNNTAIAAVALGAKIIEKHFILDKNLGGPDCAFSSDPEEFKNLVKSIREVEQALGQISYNITEEIQKNRYFSRSLFAIKDVEKGETITEENIRSLRPNLGLSPKYLNQILGKKFSCDLKKGTPIDWGIVE